MAQERSLEKLEAMLAKLEAEMEHANTKYDIEQQSFDEEIERIASLFTPLFVAILLTMAIYLIDRFVVD